MNLMLRVVTGLRLSMGLRPIHPRVIRNPRQLLMRSISSNTDDIATNTEAEHRLTAILKKRFPENYAIQVADVSGGCGAMYDVTVITPEFKGISIVKQHRMVTEVLKEEIKEMHGLRISTYHEPFSGDNKK